MTVVYGLHTVEDRKSLWPELLSIDAQINLPWCVMGDFNAVLACEDRLNGNPVSSYESQDFISLLANSDLGEYKSCGHFYSWSNKGVGDTKIASRIDRCLANTSWVTMFPTLSVEYMNPDISDHTPLDLRCSVDEDRKGKPFKFFNYMAEHSEFMSIIENYWQKSSSGVTMEHVWENLKNIKRRIK